MSYQGELRVNVKVFCVRWVSCCLVLSAEILNKCRGDLLEMKEGKLKTQPSLLENLIFFVEVRHSSCRHGRDGYFTTMVSWYVSFFCTDGVYSLVGGEPLHQDPPTTQDESAEEKKEEEKGYKHWRGTFQSTPPVSNPCCHGNPPILFSSCRWWSVDSRSWRAA